MTVQTLTIDQLEVSGFNVRVNEEDANATTAIEDSIEATGLWLPLVVHPITVIPRLRGGDGEPAKQKWGVLDGGRRCRAIMRLVDAGRLPRDWPIDCVVRDVDPAKIREASLGAYLLARDLRPYEIAAAIAKMVTEGLGAEEIARNLGQPQGWVFQQLRLGTIAPEVFDAYAAGEMSLDQARAYAATEDHDLQRAAFAHFRAHLAQRHDPQSIRAFLKVGDRELEKLLRFAGEDIYRAAGGGYELDLFSDLAQQRGRVADEPLLRKLVENKLGFERQELRRRTGRSDLRFTAEIPKHQGYPDHSLQLYPEEAESGAISLPAGDVVALLEPRDDGTTRVSWYWSSRKAQQAAQKSKRKTAKPAPSPSRPALAGDDFVDRHDYQGAQAARAAVKDEHGLTADGLQVMRSLRRELLRALLVTEANELVQGSGTLGRDYVIWAQLRQELRPSDRATVTGARGLASGWSSVEDQEPRDVVRPHLEEMEAHAVWNHALARVAEEPFITMGDAGAALRRFVQADPETKALAGAVLAGLALLRSANVPGWRIPAHDALSELAGGDPEMLRAFWAPTPAFLALFPKLKRLELAQPYEDRARINALAGAKDVEITRAAASVLAEQCWVHPLLSFAERPKDEVMTAQTQEPA